MSDVELTISVGRQEPSGFRLVLTLVVTAAISAVALSGVYQVTKPTIDANKARELERAVLEVVPGSTQLQRLELRDGSLVTAVDGAPAATGDAIYAAYDDNGTFKGYAIAGDTPGFQDTVRILYGYDPLAQRVTGMEVLASRETPGLGDKIFKDAEFVANFGNLAIEPEVVVVKDGRDAENEVDAITGATISSRAVVRIINEANAKWLPVLPEPGTEPPLVAKETDTE